MCLHLPLVFLTEPARETNRLLQVATSGRLLNASDRFFSRDGVWGKGRRLSPFPLQPCSPFWRRIHCYTVCCFDAIDLMLELCRRAVTQRRVQPRWLASPSGLCETWKMKRHARELSFSTMTQGKTITARCSLCKRVFVAEPHGNERTDDLLLKIRAEFYAHDCNLDSNQNALRILQAATEGTR